MWQHIQSIAVSLILAALVLLSCFSFFTLDSKASGGVWCVVPPGEPNGPYAACDQVFTSIQAAVDTAVDGDEIWVSSGTYTDVHTSHPYSELKYLVFFTKSLTVRGGYLPPFTDPPNYTGNPTILDAQGQGGVLHLDSPNATIEGLHITGGQNYAAGVEINYGMATLADNKIYGNGGEDGRNGVMIMESQVILRQNLIQDNGGNIHQGGGIHIFNSEVTLTENQILSNTADTLAKEDIRGGGIYAGNSSLTMTNNLVQGNTAAGVTDSAAYGGGLYVEDSHINLQGNQIWGNTAILSTTTSYVGYGGGLYMEDSSGIIDGNEIVENRAVADGIVGNGGGLFVIGEQNLMITNNLFQANAALENGSDTSGGGAGGGFYLHFDSGNGQSPLTSTITVANNTFQDNKGAFTGWFGAGGGGVIYKDDFGENDSELSLFLVDNEIVGNRGLINGQEGWGGGLYINTLRADDEEIYLINNKIISNTAAVNAGNFGLGGGLGINGQNQIYQNNLIMENVAAENGRGYGGGIGIDSKSNLLFINTVLNDNEARTGGTALFISGENSHIAMQHSTIARHHGPDLQAVLLSGKNYYDEPSFNNTLEMTNTVLVSYTTGISVSSGHTVSLNSILWHNTSIPIIAGITATVKRENEFIGDPAFAEDGYHLTVDSAAIRRGVHTGIHFDIDNEGRPFSPTLGVDEYWANKSYLPLVLKD